jgi:hypothetical protein
MAAQCQEGKKIHMEHKPCSPKGWDLNIGPTTNLQPLVTKPENCPAFVPLPPTHSQHNNNHISQLHF